MRLGRETIQQDAQAIAIVREAVGDEVHIMSDFNQGMAFGEALLRLHALDDHGLYWFEEPIVYDNIEAYAQITREIKTPIQIGENIYGPREFYKAVVAHAADLYMPDSDANRRGYRLDALGINRWRSGLTLIKSSLPGSLCALDACQ